MTCRVTITVTTPSNQELPDINIAKRNTELDIDVALMVAVVTRKLEVVGVRRGQMDMAAIWAVANGCHALVDWLIRYGCQVSEHNNWAIKFAAQNGDIAMMQLLGRHNINPHADRDIALQFAAAAGHDNMVRYLVETGADVTTRDNQSFMQAVKHGHELVVQYFITQGVESSMRAIYLAVKHGHLSILKLLTQPQPKGAVCLAASTEHEDLLIVAVKRGHVAIAKYLHQLGIAQNATYNSAIKLAAEQGDLAMVKFLHQAGSDIQTEHNAPLKHAVRHGWLHVVEYLDRAGADIRADKDKVFVLAAKHGYHHILAYILENNSADMASLPYQAAIMSATKMGHLAMVKYLFENGVESNLDPSAALKIAAKAAHFAIVRYLHQQQGADISSKNDYVLRHAVKNGDLATIKYCMRYVTTPATITQQDVHESVQEYIAMQQQLQRLRIV